MAANDDPGATQHYWGFDRARGEDVGVIVCRRGVTVLCAHEVPKGSDFRLFNGQMIVAGPSHAPYILHHDGATETVRP